MLTRISLILVTLLVLIICLSLQYGVMNLNIHNFIQVIYDGISKDQNDIAYKIITELRIPRVLMALIVGSGLGLVGLLLQTITRNELADPFLFGLSAGAATGAVFVITVTGSIFGLWTLPIFAFLGGILASLCVLYLMHYTHSNHSQNIVLTGLTVSFLFSALTNYLIFSGDQRAAHSILFWSLGGLGLAKWGNLLLPLLGFLSIFIFILIHHRDLDALLAGEETAYSLGINVTRLRYQGFIVAAFATASFVSLVGVIAFMGLMVPHIARIMTGALHRSLLWMITLIGALLMLASDLISRVILAPQELPIGIITSALGAFFMLFLLFKKQR